DDVPDRNPAAQCEKREDERLDHRQSLSRLQYAMTIPPIDPYTRERRQQEGGNLPGKAHQTESKWRFGQTENQPTGRNLRHPPADERQALPAEKQTVVAVPESAQRKFQSRVVDSGIIHPPKVTCSCEFTLKLSTLARRPSRPDGPKLS